MVVKWEKLSKKCLSGIIFSQEKKSQLPHYHIYKKKSYLKRWQVFQKGGVLFVFLKPARKIK